MTEGRRIDLPPIWVDGHTWERSLKTARIEQGGSRHVEYHFPGGCKVMVDAGARLLFLVNQQVDAGCAVTLTFDDPDGALGYLNRAGFVRLLHPGVRVLPDRPDDAVLMAREGTSGSLVEFTAISPADHASVDGVPMALSTKLCAAVGGTLQDPEVRRIKKATYTIFSELIENVYEHSQTELDGFAALQVYAAASKARIVVSDSGVGLLNTIGPALERDARELIGHADAEVLDRLLARGLSRHGSPRGAGLHRCAKYARECGAMIDLRLETCALTVSPQGVVSEAPSGAYQDTIPLRGTHFCFTIPLD